MKHRLRPLGSALMLVIAFLLLCATQVWAEGPAGVGEDEYVVQLQAIGYEVEAARTKFRTERVLSDLQAYGLPEKEIDIAFVSGFRLADERFSDHILEGIQSKVMVPMHFNFSKDYDRSVLDQVARFPNVIAFREEMTWQTIDLAMFR